MFLVKSIWSKNFCLIENLERKLKLNIFRSRFLAYNFKQFFIASLLTESRLHLGEIIMVNRFTDRWTKKESEPSLTSKIKNAAMPQQDLKEQISQVTQRLDAQTRSLDAAVHRFELRDGEIFQRVVTAMTKEIRHVQIFLLQN